MKKIVTLSIALILSYVSYAQVGVVNADSLRLGNPAGTGGMALFGKTYLKNITPGSPHDSILVRNANGSIRMVPRSVLFAAFATAADLSSYQTLANLSSDLAASATKYPSVNAVNAGLNLKANADGSNANGTWGISITGNAATATSAAQWGTQTFNGSTFITPTQLMGYTGTTWGPVSQSGLQSFLGLGSNAYNSTAYLPLAGGALSGALSGTSAGFSGNVTAGSFTGAGTGLTGTASGLHIGGNAATATAWGGSNANFSVNQLPANAAGFASYNTTSAQWEYLSLANTQTALGVSGGPFLPLSDVDESATGNKVVRRSGGGSIFVNQIYAAGGQLSGDLTTNARMGIGNSASNARLEVTQATGEVFRADAASGALRIVADQAGVTFGGTATFGGPGVFKGNWSGGSGSGTEIQYFSGAGYVQAYNRSSSAFEPIYLRGSSINLTEGHTVLGAGNNLQLSSGDIHYLSNGGFGLLSADGNRQLAVTNAGIGIANALAGSSALFSGNATAASFIRSGGTSSQFLKADGSVDNNTYLTASALGSYLPLAGGTLSGSVSGTSASFSGNVTAANLNISNWNTAYGWGNHAGAGYMTASSTNTLTNKSGNISQWTNDAGYITSSGTVSTANRLQERTSYAYSMSALPVSYDSGITNFFVGPGSGEGSWLNYGSVLNMRTYGGGGGSLQMYVPYGPGNGGDNLKVRFGNYNVSSGNSWTDWKTLANKEELGSAAYLNANASSGANTVVQRDGNGYIHNSYFNTSSGGAERNSSGLGYIAGFNSSDYYVRSYTPAALAAAMGLGSNAYSSASYLPLSGGTLSGSLSGTSSSFSGDVSASTFSGNVASNYLNKQGNSYYQANTWIQLNGAYGLYAPSYNGAHFYPNSVSSYGAWVMSGSKGAYSGIYDAYSGATYGMFDANGNGGSYDGASGWHYYWNKTNQSLGIGGSSTQSGYRATVNGALYTAGAGYFTGTVTAPTFSGALSGNASTATYATSAGSANSVAWSNVSGAPTIPTNTNQLTNGAGFITSDYTQSGLQAVTDRLASTTNNIYIGKAASNSIDAGSAIGFSSEYSASPTYGLRWQMGAGGDMINLAYTTAIGTWQENLRITNQDGHLTARGNVTSLSDARVKTNIESLSSVSEKLRGIRAVEYDRIDSKEHQIGFIAQEVQKYFPELIHTGTDERKTLSMAYQNFTAPLLKGWQEHDTIIQQQAGQIKQQDERIAQLERELAGLKEMIKRAEK